MSIKGSYGNKKVTFDTQDSSEEKIDRLVTIMNKLTTDGQRFKPKIYQGKRRGQTRNIYDRSVKLSE